MNKSPSKIAFLILTDDPARAVPGLVMATRLKANRGDEIRVLFFGPGVRLAGSGNVDEQLEGMRIAGIHPKACAANVDQYGIADQVTSRQIEMLAAGAEVERFAEEGYTVLSF